MENVDTSGIIIAAAIGASLAVGKFLFKKVRAQSEQQMETERVEARRRELQELDPVSCIVNINEKLADHNNVIRGTLDLPVSEYSRFYLKKRAEVEKNYGDAQEIWIHRKKQLSYALTDFEKSVEKAVDDVPEKKSNSFKKKVVNRTKYIESTIEAGKGNPESFVENGQSERIREFINKKLRGLVPQETLTRLEDRLSTIEEYHRLLQNAKGNLEKRKEEYNKFMEEDAKNKALYDAWNIKH